jgi:hypothetical protein
MSLAELGVTIRAINEVSPEFQQISSDAVAMASEVSGSPLVLSLDNQASPGIAQVAEDAANVKAQVEGSPVTLPFAPITIPPLPPVDTTSAQASLNEVRVAATAMGSQVEGAIEPIPASLDNVELAAAGMGSEVEAASSEAVPAMADVSAAATDMASKIEAASSSFDDMSAHADATMVSLRTVSSGIRSFGMMGTELTTLAGDFGLVDKGTEKYLRTIMTMITVASTAARMYSFLQLMTTGETAAVAVEGTTEEATTGALSAGTIAHNIYGAACNFAASCEDALNVSHATFLALTGVGIGVIIAAAAAVALFASSMNHAASSVQNYNAAANQSSAASSNIVRAQSQAMSRAGVES